jgi:uncharacterized protein DUF839
VSHERREKHMKHAGRHRTVAAVAGLATLAALSSALAATSVQTYLVPVGDRYRVTPLLSSGDEVPLTSDPTRNYRLVGFPDGMGMYSNRGDHTFTLLMNHEMSGDLSSQPVVGGPTNRGAIVSKFIVDRTGNVVSGERAYDTVFHEGTLADQPDGLPAAQTDNATPAMSRFCSGTLAWRDVGFDRPIWLAGEETQGTTGTFDGKGSLDFAIFDKEAHALPKLGRFPRENSLVLSGTGDRTVVVMSEDGPRTPDSQLYMYVGTKDRSPGASALRRNGLDNGKLYVFRSTTPGYTSETNFTEAGRTLAGEWVEIPGADTMTAPALEAKAHDLGAFGFVKIEDETFVPGHNRELVFVTTGDSTDTTNKLGRLYSMKLSDDPLGPAELHMFYNADSIVAAGGDIAIAPDNVAMSGRYLMVNEDGHTAGQPTLKDVLHRDGSVWRFDLSKEADDWTKRIDISSALRIAELDPPGRDVSHMVQPGVWETSGTIDASTFIEGPGEAWLTAVQAHAPTEAPGGKEVTAEDGQLVLLTRVR